MRRDGGTGRRSGLKIRRGQPHGGSTPPPGTIIKTFKINYLFHAVILCAQDRAQSVPKFSPHRHRSEEYLWLWPENLILIRPRLVFTVLYSQTLPLRPPAGYARAGSGSSRPQSALRQQTTQRPWLQNWPDRLRLSNSASRRPTPRRSLDTPQPACSKRGAVRRSTPASARAGYSSRQWPPSAESAQRPLKFGTGYVNGPLRLSSGNHVCEFSGQRLGMTFSASCVLKVPQGATSVAAQLFCLRRFRKEIRPTKTIFKKAASGIFRAILSPQP